jgi:sulfite reductase beta subunit-like hemoprotein
MTDDVSRNERIKEASDYLRGTLAEGLRQEITGAIGEDDQQLVKFHGLYLQDDRDLRPERMRKKMEKAFALMSACAFPAAYCPRRNGWRSINWRATTPMAACGSPRGRRCNCTASSNRI